MTKEKCAEFFNPCLNGTACVNSTSEVLLHLIYTLWYHCQKEQCSAHWWLNRDRAAWFQSSTLVIYC